MSRRMMRLGVIAFVVPAAAVPDKMASKNRVRFLRSAKNGGASGKTGQSDISVISEREVFKNAIATEFIRQTSPERTTSEGEKPSSVTQRYVTLHTIRGKLRRILIKNSTTRLASTVFDLVARSLVCVLYVVRVILDDATNYECDGLPAPCKADNNTDTTTKESNTDVNWYVLLWVERPLWLWILQVVLAFVTFFKSLLKIYVAKGRRSDHFLKTHFIMEVLTSFPYIITLAHPPILHNLYVPSFIGCWLAKRSLEKVLNDLHRTRRRFQTISVTLSQQCLVLIATLCCMIFTTVCGIEHIQRASAQQKLTLFQSIYFTIVTFSTVGYGDILPDIWPSQLFTIAMICVAVAFIPMQIQTIASTIVERMKMGSEYTERRAAGNKHVVVVSRTLQTETVMDFLSEFYAHRKLEEQVVVLMAADELDRNMQVILKDPNWSQRVVYMRGSVLRETDLKRCRIAQAEACFILAPRHLENRAIADQHTIMRSWAVKDFAPNCKQYIQLFKPENKIHVKFAEHVICEDEFKYAMLANNCLYPGLSTLVSLLVHTSGDLYGKGSVTGTLPSDGTKQADKWQHTYGRHSGNEIYHIQLGDSMFFSSYEGKTFTEASADAHQRFGISLVAVLDTKVDDPHLQLNPGPSYLLKASDMCFYISVAKEEYSKGQLDTMKDDETKSVRGKTMERTASDLQGHMNSEEEEEEYGEEESVFSTLTLHKGYELANRVKRATFSLGEKSIPVKETEQKFISNSDNSCRSSFNLGKPVSSNGGLDNAGFEVGQVIQSAESTTPRSRTPVDFQHMNFSVDSTFSPVALDHEQGQNSSDNGDVDSSHGQPITSDGCIEKSRFKVTQVNLSAESQLQRRGTGINLTAESTLPIHAIGVYLSAESPLLRRRSGVNLSAEAPVPRSVTPVDFHHVEGTNPSKKDQVLDKFLDMDQDEFITGPSPVTLYVGSKRAICHLMREQRPLCCLEWGLNCSHCAYKNTNDQRWTNQLIILSAEKACNGIYNFIVPLRSQFIGMKSLCPIILLLGEKPERMFLETVSFFPLVYWMLGTITSVDDLLMAGINKASHLVVANKEMVQSVCEDTLADSETIVAVQTVFKLFPKVNILTELKQASNMRFMHFRAHDEYSQKISDMDRKLKSSITSNTSHIFRLPFASGQVFSASMLDTLLYQ
ncbi:hypothetical protein DPMN_001099, partial [Dreissena polymorpha]